MTTAADLRHNAEAFLDRFPESLKNQSNQLLQPPKYTAGIPFVIDPELTDRTQGNQIGDKEDNGTPSRLFREFFGVQTRTPQMRVWPHIGRLPAPDTKSQASVAQSVDTFDLLETFRLTGGGAPVLSATSLTLPQATLDRLNRDYNSAGLKAFLRLIFLSRDGRTVLIRPVTTVTTTGLQWTQPVPSAFLPGSGSPQAALVARLEMQQVRYSWLMAVRPIAGSDMFDVDVVSYFQRPSRSSDPTVLSKPYHEMLFQVWSYQRPNGSNGPNGQMDTRFGLQAGQSQYVVIANGNDTPIIRKGGFLVDGENNRWYRIANVKEAFPAVGQWLVYLDRPV
ncbi:MAG: hypothetical protein ACKO3P_05890, partial [Planctomycetaceae bacterium]